MSKLLVLGGSGMLGHVLARTASRDHEVWATARGSDSLVREATGLRPNRILTNFNALSTSDLDRVLTSSSPEYVINCVGLIPQSPAGKDKTMLRRFNADLPRQLAQKADSGGFRVIHISSDCVFSGMREVGGYSEIDVPDPIDDYGRSKVEGEDHLQEQIVLRTSFIGLELERRFGLLEWFLGQQSETVLGYKNAMWSGLPTRTVAHVISQMIPDLHETRGVYHLATNSISKADLLKLIGDTAQISTRVTDVAEPRINRTLDSTKFREQFTIDIGTWPSLVDQLGLESRQ